MKILIDTIEIKDQYSLYYHTLDLCREGDVKYYTSMAAVLRDYIKDVVEIRGYITMEKCFERLQDYIGTLNGCDFPVEFMFAGYANSEDVDVQFVLIDGGHRCRFDFLNVKDISPVLLNNGTIGRKNILREGYYEL